MKKRLVRKTARKFLATRKPVYGTYTEECRTHTDGRPGVHQTWARMPEKVGREIRRQAAQQGWDGCHWSNPLILTQDMSALLAWEEDHPGR